MIKEWIAEYNPRNEEETISALREIMQEIVLAGLSRTDFYEKAAFYGGTALRIFYQLDRFSEDLDFSLLEKDHEFSLETYFAAIVEEFDAIGIKVSIREKNKTTHTHVDSAFLKSETIWKELVLENIVKQAGISSHGNIRIKIEVDRNPTSGFETEEKLLLRPFSFYVKCFTQPNLFAGKMHALLFRKWKNRVKGRDWYDLEWYIKKGIPLDSGHFVSRARETGDWKKNSITKEEIRHLLRQKINVVSFDQVRDDVGRFVKNDQALKIWSVTYFNDLVEKLKVV